MKIENYLVQQHRMWKHCQDKLDRIIARNEVGSKRYIEAVDHKYVVDQELTRLRRLMAVQDFCAD